MESLTRKVIIVGGGFGGVRTALDLKKKSHPDLEVLLVSDKPYLEYHPSLYRVVSGEPYSRVRLPLEQIFSGTRVKVIEERINQLDLENKTITGVSGSRYEYDFLVLALGSQTTFFEIPGLSQLSFPLKTISDALRLNTHLRELFRTRRESIEEDVEDIEEEEDVQRIHSKHIVIIGGGETGTELAGQLAVYTKDLAKMNEIDPSQITIDLIDSGTRVLKRLPENISRKVHRRLRLLDVNIFLNRRVVREEIRNIYLKDMTLKTLTVVWAAGVQPNDLYARTKGLSLDKRKRVLVDEFLQPGGLQDIFVIGDGGSTPYSGTAQNAISQGRYVADIIFRSISGKTLFPFVHKEPAHAIPVGPKWAAVKIGRLRLYGRLGWWLRELATFRFFISMLPPGKAWAFMIKRQRDFSLPPRDRGT
ncbi:MAG: FAD-dependent oxidoreductase [Thaumarchaeota archaeon]|nr:FAD-dependent oxidoreductase [Nitrososphaerota archaeon]